MADFHRGIRLIAERKIPCIELSALRIEELDPLVSEINDIDLSAFSHISVHVPTRIQRTDEKEIVERLHSFSRRGWPIILHPDVVHDFSLWHGFGHLLCIENMDKRKPSGKTVQEMREVFSVLPEAAFCFDMGHARQVDPSMMVAHSLLKEFGPRLREVHMSDVDASSRHNALSDGSILAFQEMAGMIPESVPVILESIVQAHEIDSELTRAQEALKPDQPLAASIRPNRFYRSQPDLS